MFNAERLLGKVINEIIGAGLGANRSGGSGSLLNNLTSGTGLMTVIGLGIGAYEILSEKNQSQATPAAATPPPLPANQTAPMPPPPPNGPVVSTPLPEAPATAPAQLGEELSTRMIRIMIAATHADGILDADEEKAILDKLKEAELSQEEKIFLLDELQHPRTIAELTADITDPTVAKTMYMLAAHAISIDSEAERQWLDELASSLGLSKAIQSFLEESR